MAKRLSTGFHSRMGIVHFRDACWMARYTTFKAYWSLGKILRWRMALRITLLSDSMALVV